MTRTGWSRSLIDQCPHSRVRRCCSIQPPRCDSAPCRPAAPANGRAGYVDSTKSTPRPTRRCDPTSPAPEIAARRVFRLAWGRATAPPAAARPAHSTTRSGPLSLDRASRCLTVPCRETPSASQDSAAGPVVRTYRRPAQPHSAPAPTHAPRPPAGYSERTNQQPHLLYPFRASNRLPPTSSRSNRLRTYVRY